MPLPSAFCLCPVRRYVPLAFGSVLPSRLPKGGSATPPPRTLWAAPPLYPLHPTRTQPAEPPTPSRTTSWPAVLLATPPRPPWTGYAKVHENPELPGHTPPNFLPLPQRPGLADTARSSLEARQGLVPRLRPLPQGPRSAMLEGRDGPCHGLLHASSLTPHASLPSQALHASLHAPCRTPQCRTPCCSHAPTTSRDLTATLIT